jgi:16S rRNA (guanine527-N7)-methyltransferase
MSGGRRDPSDALAADRAQALSLLSVSRETLARLDDLVAVFLAWQRAINLVAPSTLPKLWTRHIADSFQLVRLAPAATSWVDMGSGGGFPGLVIACALADAPECVVHLIESNGKKAAFLQEATRRIVLPATVHHRRIEDFVASSPPAVDVVTARALAPLSNLLNLAEPLLKRGAQGLFPKGQDVEAELTEASRYWNIAVELVPSMTEPRGRIVIVRQGERRPAAAVEPTKRM